MRDNAVKRKLRAGTPAIGCAMGLMEPFVAEMMAAAGFDFLLVDTEHSPYSIHQLQTILIALHPSDSTIIVRAPWNEPVAVKQILDLGAEGIVFPWVNSREECEAAVAAAKYPPEGIRGIGPRRAARLAGGLKPYLARANDQVLVLAQVERVEAVDHLDAILETPGLDGIMVGPADLAASLGYLQDLDNVVVERAIHRVLDGCLAHGVPFGIFSGTAERARKWIEHGALIATVGGDVPFLDAGIARAKEEIASILADQAEHLSRREV